MNMSGFVGNINSGAIATSDQYHGVEKGDDHHRADDVHASDQFGDHEEDDEGGGRRSTGEGDRNSAGSTGNFHYRWPRHETMTLLKIRSDMDVAFRESSLKGPLWEEVSRKLAGLGYHRSAKKCKEKFENIYKYHKRTKEGRATKKDGKNYRFSDQLEALDRHTHNTHKLNCHHNDEDHHHHHHHQKIDQIPSVLSMMAQISAKNDIINNASATKDFQPTSTSSSSYSFSSSGDEDYDEPEATRKTKKKKRRRRRKFEAFFENLMKDVIEKQENLQKKFLEVLEKREHERTVREEAWKMQEVARLNREQEILAQERAMAAARDTAVIAFLNKISESQPNNTLMMIRENVNPNNPSPPTAAAATPLFEQNPPNSLMDHHHQQRQQQQQQHHNGNNDRISSNNMVLLTASSSSSSRWPKSEVEALIKLRAGLDRKYNDQSSPKGHLWEEISTGMKNLGYDRSAKKCKEKWENINKYFKKVKESNKKRPEDSKTCPYFDQLDALYKEKMININHNTSSLSSPNVNANYNVRNITGSSSDRVHQEQTAMKSTNQPVPNIDNGGKPEEEYQEEDDDDGDDVDDDDDDGDEDEADGYEIAAVAGSNLQAPSSMAIVE